MRTESRVTDAATSVPLRAADRKVSAPGTDRKLAVQAWAARPQEDSASSLVRAFYPELVATDAQADAAPLNPHTALSVKLPARSGEPMEISTRGYTFAVTRVETLPPSAAKHGGFASSYGARRLLAAAGPSQRQGARLLTQRIEEYEIVEGSDALHATYRMQLPTGLNGLRDAGDYLELSDGRGGAPVLRMHYPQVRDAQGTRRTGTVALRGVSAVAGERGELLATASTFEAEMRLDLAGLQGPLVVDPGWSSTGSLATGRSSHTATRLSSGKVLVAGGETAGASFLGSAELYDPTTGTWTVTGSMSGSRGFHTATLLPSGKVLVAGGWSGGSSVDGAELYDPATGLWTPTDALQTARHLHTATLLASGKVLIAAGGSGGGETETSELYDPTTATWSYTAGALGTARGAHTATLLPSGKLLVAGGYNDALGLLASSELYDPTADTWSPAGALGTPSDFHTATLLPSGQVLAAGGEGPSGQIATAQLFDPAANGGVGAWSPTDANSTARHYHTATLLPSGNVFITGGSNGGGSSLASTELYDSVTDTWSTTSSLVSGPVHRHTATLLASGKLLIVGGFDTSHVSTVELYTPGAGAWAPASAGTTFRHEHTATLLPSGKVLVTGGANDSSTSLYDPATGSWSGTGPLPEIHTHHTATLLPSGKVLVAGGAADGSAALYDPAAGTWAATGSLAEFRQYHTATLLPSGKVLVAGGSGSSGELSSAEIFDPAANGGLGEWSATGSLTEARNVHTATLLPSGQVLVAGGVTGFSTALASVELFDPAANGGVGTWSTIASLDTARYFATATLLPSGTVLVAGGDAGGTAIATAELYDPVLGTWSTTGPLAVPRFRHAARLLPSGEVLVLGGYDTTGVSSVELYDPALGTWSATASMGTARYSHTATLLTSGKVLAVGGLDSGNQYTPLDELYEDTGALDAWHPAVSAPQVLASDASASVSGTGFRGLGGGSSGRANDSPTDSPRVSLQSIEGERFFTLDVGAFTATSATVSVPASVSMGQYIVWVTANGIYGGRVSVVWPRCTASQYQSAAPTATTPPVCTALTQCSAGVQYESTAPTATSDRVCTACTAGACTAIGNCGVNQYESSPATSMSDRVCMRLTTCTSTEYESTAPTATRDRVCMLLTTCGVTTEYESTAPTATSNRSCTALTTCSASQYASTAPTATTDRSCTALTTCSASQYQSTAPTATSDRVCTRLTACDDDEYESSSATDTSDRECSPCSECAAGTMEMTACSATGDTVCEPMSMMDMPDAAVEDGSVEDGSIDEPSVDDAGQSQDASDQADGSTESGSGGGGLCAVVSVTGSDHGPSRVALGWLALLGLVVLRRSWRRTARSRQDARSHA